MQRSPCLWFDTQGEEAATFHTSIFKELEDLSVARYGTQRDRGQKAPS